MKKDNPCIEFFSGKAWFNEAGCYHREDGPAIIASNGDKYFFLEGLSLSKEEWFAKLTLEQKENIIWLWNEL